MESLYCPIDNVIVLPSSEPVPAWGVLPVFAYLLRGPEPVLVDTGTAREHELFLDALDHAIDPSEIRWVLLTHEDADHAGSIGPLLERAPNARLVTTPTGFGKLRVSWEINPSRLQLVLPGQEFETGRRKWRAARPPMYDSPATLSFLERDRGWLFSSDAFGAFLPELTERCDEVHFDSVVRGMLQFCGVNSPWLAHVSARDFHAQLLAFAALNPSWLLASHLPPLEGTRFDALIAAAETLPAYAAELNS